MKRILCIIAFILLFVLCLKAQTQGRVADAQGRPVAFANVVALAPADSAVVAACVSGEDGAWHLPDTLDVQLLRVAALGYEPLYYRVAEKVSTLTLVLREERSQTLGEATVAVRRPVAKLEGGALVTTIEHTALSKAGSAEDVLAQVPGIIRKNDEDGTLEVIGRGAPLIYINGRQLRDLSELKQLRSEEIKSVEVIHTPGARYDASVSAVVRIRTVRRKGEGWGVSLSEDYGQGKYATNNTRLKVNYRKNGIDIYAGGNFEARKHYWNSLSDQVTATPDTLWMLPMGQDAVSENLEAGFDAGFNLDLGDSHALGVRYQAQKLLKTDAGISLDSRIQANGEYYDELTNRIRMEGDADWQHALNAYYAGRLGKGELTLDADFFADGKQDATHTHEQSAEFEDRSFTSENRTRNRLVATKAQYEWPWLKGKVAVGGQFTLTNRHDDYLIPSNDFGVATSFSKQRERNAAAFVQYSALLARRYQLTAGVRYEHAVYDYYQNGERQAGQSPVYDNVFPSLSLATALGRKADKVQLMLAYTAKTQRPNYAQLSNNVSYGNRFLLQTGNPHLKPTVQHNVAFTAVWKFLQGVATFDHFKDGILFWGTSNPQKPAITTVSHINKSYSQFQAVLTAAPHFGFYHPSYTLVYHQSYLRMPVVGGTRSFNNPMFLAFLGNVFDLPVGFKLNLTYRYQSRGSYQNVDILKPTHWLEAYVTKSFLQDALTVNAGCQDILHRSENRVAIDMESSRFIQGGVGDTRRFYLKMSYNFNAMRNKSRSKSEVEQTIKRL